MWRQDVSYQVLTAASTKTTAFWDIVPCGHVEFDKYFRSLYCLHHQGVIFRRQDVRVSWGGKDLNEHGRIHTAYLGHYKE
jgi:hypothetical protein